MIAHTVAPEGIAPVRGVFDPVHAERAEKSLQLRPWRPKQRAQETPGRIHGLHAAKSGPAGTAHKPHQHILTQIIKMMAGNNPLRTSRPERRIKKRVPGTPPRVFKADPFRTRQRLHIHAPHHAGHAEPFREAPRGLRLLPAFRAKPMIEVRQHEGYAEATQDHGQRRGIRAARKGHDDMVRRYAALLFQKTPDRHAQPSPGGR